MNIEILSATVAGIDEELRVLQTQHALHNEMLDASHEATTALVNASDALKQAIVRMLARVDAIDMKLDALGDLVEAMLPLDGKPSTDTWGGV